MQSIIFGLKQDVYPCLKIKDVSLYRMVEVSQIYSVINTIREQRFWDTLYSKIAQSPLIDSTLGLLLSPNYSRIK